jgi:bacterioferritin (cytochrome b1)
MADPSEPLDHDRALRALTEAIRLQYRSALAYTIVGGSIVGFDHLALAPSLVGYGLAELEDCGRLIERITALDGQPPTMVAEMETFRDPVKAIGWLLTVEQEALDAIHGVIEATGGDSQSEALEHRIEHIVMRKQEQLEALRRGLQGERERGER